MFNLLAAAASLAVAAPTDTPQIFMGEINYPLVHQVLCKEGAGTAFRIGPRRFLSVAHVTTLHNCTIDKAPITVIEQDGNNDFSIVEAGPPQRYAVKVSCEGFKTFEWYWAVGYAYGLPFQTVVALNATAFDADNGERILTGRYSVIPGMSGGPILNGRGEVVGTVNMYDPARPISLSRSLKDTSVCKKR